ncbi:PP2C family protein-serine/threonine phosphatase [Thiorhodovibrio frisius]|uniref:Serine/threonine protein phosphatase n=1 Tax=Thiorhodovibrio frisius TaxID=631362 RepID=H8YXE8_9GAMM|nr:PP2C family serine/threonine-protein phosphatase [Thiorhodovibrio frisius]EIC23124.1 serine/threonine protein phosphatase [Thiorhodovibrio frisius]WPL22612.1 Serine/threonine phosphatase stp [Thiorhodovibrio frisius]
MAEQKPALEFASRTHLGMVRKGNEDSVAVHPENYLAIVADGVGGASAGEVASRMAVDLIGERFIARAPSRSEPRIAQLLTEAAVDEANVAIIRHAKEQPECSGMGTTVVMGFFGQGWMVYGHVGDSRLYRLRDGELKQLTRDHSFIQEVVDQGFFPTLADAREYGITDNVLTRALGSAAHIKATTDTTELVEGDLYLLCSDGLTGMVPTEELQNVLVAASSLETAADTLIKLACKRGGVDNITVALVRVNQVEQPQDAPANSTEPVDTES